MSSFIYTLCADRCVSVWVWCCAHWAVSAEVPPRRSSRSHSHRLHDAWVSTPSFPRMTDSCSFIQNCQLHVCRQGRWSQMYVLWLKGKFVKLSRYCAQGFQECPAIPRGLTFKDWHKYFFLYNNKTEWQVVERSEKRHVKEREEHHNHLLQSGKRLPSIRSKTFCHENTFFHTTVGLIKTQQPPSPPPPLTRNLAWSQISATFVVLLLFSSLRAAPTVLQYVCASLNVQPAEHLRASSRTILPLSITVIQTLVISPAEICTICGSTKCFIGLYFHPQCFCYI